MDGNFEIHAAIYPFKCVPPRFSYYVTYVSMWFKKKQLPHRHIENIGIQR
jgi:hypothetical protein